jgi:hypothetical protein
VDRDRDADGRFVGPRADVEQVPGPEAGRSKRTCWATAFISSPRQAAGCQCEVSGGTGRTQVPEALVFVQCFPPAHCCEATQDRIFAFRAARQRVVPLFRHARSANSVLEEMA